MEDKKRYFRRKRKENYKKNRARILREMRLQNKYGREFLKVAGLQKVRLLLRMAKKFSMDTLRMVFKYYPQDNKGFTILWLIIIICILGLICYYLSVR